MYGLIIGLLLLITFGIYEFQKCKISRKKIPMIIHVNGTRGKSSVTRLIAAGLRTGGKKTIAKTTGSAPTLIYEDGSETPIIRHHGANIKEQVKIIQFAAKKKIDILVLECMAVTPEYQWVTEHEIVQSNIGIITNSRLDHLDVMGPGLKNVTRSLCNTIPKHGVLFTAEKKVFPIIQKEAEKVHCEIIQSEDSGISNEDMQGFSYIEHKENVALSLKVCEHFGIDKKIALEGMYTAQPDIGAMEIYKHKSKDKELHFVHAFAANDPESTEFVINSVKELYPHTHAVVIVLSTRADRIYRSKQLVQMLKNVEYDHLYLIGEQTNTIYSYAMYNKLDKSKITNCSWITGLKLTNCAVKLPAKEILMLGIGNIGGNGGLIVDYYKKRNKNV
ncbi:MAG: poly-gamma-glutamate synthase PgsB [Candidatus Tenebribacter burtonii]|nr:poly-gamma-glutamate synthase PgsB [Candidatus Tenebribacter burtonii]